MKQTPLAYIRLLTFFAAITCGAPMHASGQIKVEWNGLCATADGHPLCITTRGGDTIEGYRLSVNVDEIAVATMNQKVVKIARSALPRILMRQPEKGQLRSLGQSLHNSLHKEVGWLLSPYAPLGLVTLPVTLGWGALSAPFCALDDLRNKIAGKKEIKLI